MSDEKLQRENSAPRLVDVAVITINLTLPRGTRQTPEVVDALNNLASVMLVQAEDGLYTDGGGRHGEGEHLLDFIGRDYVDVSII